VNSGAPKYLTRLQADGRIPMSAFSPRALAEIKTLLDSEILSLVRSSRGDVIVVRQGQELADWIEHAFPSSGANLDLRSLPRALAAATRRNTKRGKTTHHQQTLLVRALNTTGGAQLNGKDWPIGQHTQRFGVAAVVIDESTTLTLPANFGLVENQEVFFNCERILPNIETVLYSSGRASSLLIKILARSLPEKTAWWHFPDYDPVGLDEHLRLRSAGCRPTLFIPHNLSDLWERYGQRPILEKRHNSKIMERLSRLQMPSEAQTIFDLIRNTGKVLEQESLLADLAR
jgi:hypothetical protein